MTATLVTDENQALTDSARLAALARSGLMDSAPEPVFDRLTDLATRLMDAPVSLVSLVDDHRQFFKSQCGLTEEQNKDRGTPLSHSFCQHVVVRGEPLIVFDAHSDERVQGNLAIRDLGVTAYLGIPLMTADGQALGSFCAIDTKPRQWTDEQVSIMSDLASAVQSEIGLRLALKEADRVSKERDLLIGELNHRVKNLFSMISGMIGVTARHSPSPEAMAISLRGRISALATAHNLVRPAISGIVGSEAGINFHEVATIILAPHDRIGSIDIDGPLFMLDSQSGARISLVLHELATNAAKYGALSERGGALSLSWTLNEETLNIVWIETVARKPDQSKPDSADQTRATTLQPGGFGARLIDGAIISQMGGSITRDWPKTGLEVRISIPRNRIEQG